MKTDRDLFIVSLLTFLTVILWITSEFLKTVKTTTVSTSVQQLTIPLTTTIDLDTLKVLQEKKAYQ